MPTPDPDFARQINGTNPKEDGSNPVWASPTPTPSLKHERFRREKLLIGIIAGKVLKQGSRGMGVKALQRAFVDMGFLLPNTADGIFGHQTAKAVTNFQIHASKAFPGIGITGFLEANTLHALDKLAPMVGHWGQSKNLPVPYYKGTRVNVLVIKDEHRTFLFDKQGNFQRVFINAVGALTTPTTTGLKFISTKLDEAAATALGEKLWQAPVFGARILDLTWASGTRSGEELHGTIAPQNLGEDGSHGCIRHANDDIITMYDMLHVGDKVAIVESVADPNLHA